MTETALSATPRSVESHAEQRRRVRDEVIAALRPLALPDTRFVDQIEHFIPAYPGSELLVDTLTDLPFWSGDGTVYATPDNNLEGVRTALILEGRDLIQTIAVRLGFRHFAPGSVTAGFERLAGTLDGADLLSSPIDLDGIRALGPLDFVVSGCRAVNVDGVRFGKGHGYFDIEWGILSALGVASQDTPIVVACHDVQVVDEELSASANDTIVDWIVTPTRVIEVKNDRTKPIGIDWDRLRADQFASMPPVRALKAMGL
ncbi:5-formyltetrahydrofolate cyclo-ligase [Amnibacterium flavum]|uniref:5-formyltetrahydrofolate cyclo-ligase n=1 Tax=Amnibacterium flavum TaxID=2173173 RepID=A0A2V1HW46_9MICO|nr:5-formyltetrahydrofolate cyclo-ligase [Amnibacterium flavum]PVZ94444.1 5-formyltetrahydrofolate cyclo-ligase [Amnibacterium flavum]